MDRLGAMETFVRVAELGSFNRAATQQGITPQAVSKAIRQLERELGLRLFHRTTRRSTLTDEGKAFLARLRPGLESIHEAWSEAHEFTREQGGLIRIAAPPLVGKKILVDLIARYRAEHPAVEFELLLEDRYTDLVAAGIHLGFRAGHPPERQLVVRELFRLQLIVCAAPDYLRRHGIPQRIEDLEQHACTGSRAPNSGRIEPWEFMEDGELRLRSVRAPFHTNDFEAETLAVTAGIGIGQIDSINTAALLREQRLVPLLCEHVSERHGVYLYYPPRAGQPLRVRRFIDYVLGAMRGGEAFRFRTGELEALQQRFRRTLKRAGS